MSKLAFIHLQPRVWEASEIEDSVGWVENVKGKVLKCSPLLIQQTLDFVQILDNENGKGWIESITTNNSYCYYTIYYIISCSYIKSLSVFIRTKQPLRNFIFFMQTDSFPNLDSVHQCSISRTSLELIDMKHCEF